MSQLTSNKFGSVKDNLIYRIVLNIGFAKLIANITLYKSTLMYGVI
ncbi:hypothetical protein THF1C08_160007 [Vibrio jasicida]|uniref:Uncharacterized protein n=1 Tax=Vibrio jasicida TaxID=766224 RepID=A0AAU9QHK5_9VIBR|nr:hypothetical protein THF1C08_160007 [Vibrio jasicida]CAH1576185.1 hypothetical protein THF1A12_140007 [Vibrio jasicida]CAH1608479.1 hypothetical protein THF5G08_60199 [Vibrio jasicida]